MSGGPSQPKVIGEEWSDERVRAMLERKPYDGSDPDYFVLEEAYEHMIADDFSRFVDFFVEAGRNLNAVGPQGETLMQRVKGHRRAVDYAAILEKAGALSV